jgi:hypothetical protein
MAICMSVCVPICMSIRVSVRMSVGMSICVTVYVSIDVAVCVSISVTARRFFSRDVDGPGMSEHDPERVERHGKEMRKEEEWSRGQSEQE